VVDVMNDFGSLKNATKTLGHDETMLQDIAIGGTSQSDFKQVWLPHKSLQILPTR